MKYIVISLFIFSIFQSATSGADTSKDIKNSSKNKEINFSTYYPLKKGTFRSYKVIKEGNPERDVRQVWTNGATYDGEKTVRTCESFLEWDDEAHIGGQVLSFAARDEFGNAVNFDVPLFKGIDNWKVGKRITSMSNIQVGSISEPFKLNIIFKRIENIHISGKEFIDTAKIDFTINNGASSGSNWYAKGIGMVRAEFSDGERWELSGHGVLPDPPPSILKVIPPSGKDDEDSLVTIKVEGFQKGAQLFVNGRKINYVTDNDVETIKANISSEILERGYTFTIINPDCQTALLEFKKQKNDN